MRATTCTVALGCVLLLTLAATSSEIPGGDASPLPLPMTIEDFRLPGTQIGDVVPGTLRPSSACGLCHGNYSAEPANEPWNWRGSLMGQAGRDPLFYAQLTLANQDVESVGYYCLRCHVPMSFVSGNAYDSSGASLDQNDRDGVTCHFCHSMVDPIYRPGTSPPEDLPVLDGLLEIPRHYGNSMFVVDPSGLRRGPYSDARPPHRAIPSPFHRSSALCGTCHDVGNVAVTRQPDGSFRYNAIDEATAELDPAHQFPLERTFTEWRLSAFAREGVDMAGRFGGHGATKVSTCQDCHMPRTSDRGCASGPHRRDLPRHEFAGASAWVLEIIARYWANDGQVNLEALERGRAAAISMVQRAASLELSRLGKRLRVRVINESGHKLPTGHIEGRRVWIHLSFFDRDGRLLREHGHYDAETAELDEASTEVYEMRVGLSPDAARVTGLPAGATTHMSLADTIVKDTRIPPRGFTNAAFEAAGAPVVGARYADGQHWADASFAIPPRAVKASATVFYQTVTREYIETLQQGNRTDDWGRILHDLWLETDKAAPTPILSRQLVIEPLEVGEIAPVRPRADARDGRHRVE